MKLQAGVYHVFMRENSYYLADIDRDGVVLNIPEPIVKQEIVELIIDQIQRGINKAKLLTCATIDPITGRAKYVDLVRLLTEGLEEVPARYRTETDKVRKAQPIGLTEDRQKQSRRAKGLLRRSGLTKHKLARKLGVTFRKVDGVMEGRSEIPPGWETYLKNCAKQHKKSGLSTTLQGQSMNPLEAV
jgi:hypothetical protein